MKEEWRRIQQESNLPRQIEQYNEFLNRFQGVHAQQQLHCKELEASISHTRTGEEIHDAAVADVKITELWTLMKTLENDIKECIHCATQGGAAAPVSGGSEPCDVDPLDTAFQKFYRYDQICASLSSRLGRTLDIRIQDETVQNEHDHVDANASTSEPAPTTRRRSRRRTKKQADTDAHTDA